MKHHTVQILINLTCMRHYISCSLIAIIRVSTLHQNVPKYPHSNNNTITVLLHLSIPLTVMARVNGAKHIDGNK